MSQNILGKLCLCLTEEGRARQRLLQQREEGAGAEAGGACGGQTQDPQWGEADEIQGEYQARGRVGKVFVSNVVFA